MTKKNLSDLLKAEASDKDTAAATPTNGKASASPAAGKAPRSSSRLTKADLEKQIAQLEADLKASRAKEVTAAKQVEGLKADLAKQQTHVFELKTAHEQAHEQATALTDKLQKVTAELDDAKQTILKMTEAAAKPAAAKPTPQKAQDKPAAKPALSVKMPQGGDIARRSRRLPMAKPIPDYAIEHGEQKNRMLSNDEIGWVD